MAGFERTLDELFAQAAPQSLLDVGCGEGVLDAQVGAALARRPRRRHRPRGPALQAEWAKRQAPNLEYRS